MTFFTAEDFETMDVWHSDTLAKHCNEKLQREAKVVYGKDRQWDIVPDSESAFGCTHKGLLICVEEIDRKPCEHEPVTAFHGSDDCFIPACRKCGVKLKATWEVCE